MQNIMQDLGEAENAIYNMLDMGRRITREHNIPFASRYFLHSGAKVSVSAPVGDVVHIEYAYSKNGASGRIAMGVVANDQEAVYDIVKDAIQMNNYRISSEIDGVNRAIEFFI